VLGRERAFTTSDAVARSQNPSPAAEAAAADSISFR
jgi:hypothetical protein